MALGILEKLDWAQVRRLYDARVKVSENLSKLYDSKSTPDFAELALGISNPDGNYSAAEHGLGPKILASNRNAEPRIFDLVGEFKALTTARPVPELIKKSQIKYLQIGVGSEISCLINPKACWVCKYPHDFESPPDQARR